VSVHKLVAATSSSNHTLPNPVPQSNEPQQVAYDAACDLGDLGDELRRDRPRPAEGDVGAVGERGEAAGREEAGEAAAAAEEPGGRAGDRRSRPPLRRVQHVVLVAAGTRAAETLERGAR